MEKMEKIIIRMKKILVKMQKILVRMKKFLVKVEKNIGYSWQDQICYLEAVTRCLSSGYKERALRYLFRSECGFRAENAAEQGKIVQIQNEGKSGENAENSLENGESDENGENYRDFGENYSYYIYLWHASSVRIVCKTSTQLAVTCLIDQESLKFCKHDF